MVSFDYSGLDAAFLVAGIVFWSLVAAVVFLVVGWLTQRLRRKWLLSARVWLRCSLGISTVFSVVCVAVAVDFFRRDVRLDVYVQCWALIWLSLAVAALLCLRCVAGAKPAA